MRQLPLHFRGLVAAALALGFVVEVHAAVPRGVLFQRRGRMSRTPLPPPTVDSSPTIDTLNKALKALGATDRDYDGHRKKAVAHIAEAIQHLETSTNKGKSNAAIEKAANGHPAVATATATTPEDASDESLHKAKVALFKAHHQLADHISSRGQIHADVQVRRAIDEVVAALKPDTTKPTAKAAAPPSAKPAASPAKPK